MKQVARNKTQCRVGSSGSPHCFFVGFMLPLFDQEVSDEGMFWDNAS